MKNQTTDSQDNVFDRVNITKITDWPAFLTDQLKYGTQRHKYDSAPSDWLDALWSAVPAIRPHIARFAERLGEITDADVFLEAIRLIDGLGIDNMNLDLDRFVEILNKNFHKLPPRQKLGQPYVYDLNLKRFVTKCRTPEAQELRRKLNQKIAELG